MTKDLGVAASPPGHSAEPEPAKAVSAASAASVPNAEDGYEARVFSAYLPHRTIAFIYRDGEPRFAGGVFRITRVRTATEQDERDFPSPPEGICPLCGQVEPE